MAGEKPTDNLWTISNEKLIMTVHAFPVLYNASMHDYRCAERRVNAWRQVAASLGLSVIECKRRWKTLRDRYIRENRLCKLKKEEGGRRMHYWPHRQSLSFLDAHVRKKKRPTDAEASPLETEDSDVGRGEEPKAADPKPEGARCEEPKTDGAGFPEQRSVLKAPLVSTLNSLSPVPIVAQLTPLQTLTVARGQKPSSSRGTPIMTNPNPNPNPNPTITGSPLMPGAPPITSGAALQVVPRDPPAISTIPPVALSSGASFLTGADALLNEPATEREKVERALDEDELFLLSYVPALKRLPPLKRLAVKMQIQQLMFDAEFKD